MPPAVRFLWSSRHPNCYLFSFIKSREQESRNPMPSEGLIDRCYSLCNVSSLGTCRLSLQIICLYSSSCGSSFSLFSLWISCITFLNNYYVCFLIIYIFYLLSFIYFYLYLYFLYLLLLLIGNRHKNDYMSISKKSFTIWMDIMQL